MPSDLTFAELRFASMMRATGKVPDIDPPPPPHFDKVLLSHDKAGISRMVADMVITADRLALAKGVDLAQAIRERLEPKLLEGGGQQDDLERE